MEHWNADRRFSSPQLLVTHNPFLFFSTTFASVGVSALYMDPMDFILTQAIPQLVPPLLINAHPVVIWLGALIGSINAVHTCVIWRSVCCGCYRTPFFCLYSHFAFYFPRHPHHLLPRVSHGSCCMHA